MKTSSSLLVALLTLCMITTALSLQCYECTNSPGFTGVSTCDSDDVTKKTCDGPLADRCMTVTYNFTLLQTSTIVVTKNCSNSLACDPDFAFNYETTGHCPFTSEKVYIAPLLCVLAIFCIFVILDICRLAFGITKKNIENARRCKVFEITGLVSDCSLKCCEGDLCNSALGLAASFYAIFSALALTVFVS